jgi:amino acid adenylation domain-containing protein
MGTYALSPEQLARWNARRVAPDFPWSVSLTLLIEGALEPEALRRELATAAARHEILRTRFVSAAAGAPPAMKIEADLGASLEVFDWSAKTLVERERECRALELTLRRPYPLDGAAPLRAALARVRPDSHVLVLAQDALAADWRSLHGLAKDLLRGLAGEPPADSPGQFADIAQWLRDALQSEDGAEGLAHWRALDLGGARALRLPLEFVRASEPFGLREVSRELAPRVFEGLRQLAQRRSLPMSALLFALWQAWLARASELSELTLGVSTSGRAFQGLEHALGPFEGLLPVPARIDERTSWTQLARVADQRTACGAEWQEFFRPEALGETADFGFAYAFEHVSAEPVFECGGRRAEILRRDGHSALVRGLLRVEEHEQGCELRFAFDARCFSEGDAAAMADPYLDLLGSALERPDAPLVELSATSDASRARLLAASRGPALLITPSGPRFVHEWILETARAHPEAIAVVSGGSELTYRVLEQRSAALAAELAAAGVTQGTLVGIHLERSVELVVALFAVLRAGGAYVPLPPSYPRERVLGMLADSRALLVVGSRTSAAALDGYRGRLLDVAAPRANATFVLREPLAESSTAYVIYTSGSTGKPKGVPISHANLLYSTRARLATYRERVQRYLLLSSFAFDSSVAGIFWTLVQGGTLVLPSEGFEHDLVALPGMIARHRISHLLGLPSLWSLVLDQARPGELDSLTTVIVAGESCPSELVRRHHALLPRVQLYNEYGPTEGTVWSTVFDTSTPWERAQVPIGRPIPGARNYVLTSARELAPVGVAGELWIGGPGIAAGYLERPELTAERFAADPFTGERMYKTGDRARLLPDGNLEFLGRLDHQVKIRGYRIELEEIEAALATHPTVREAVVLARGDGKSAGQESALRLVAYVVPIGPRPAETDLVRYLAARLPDYMVPARAVVLEEWPRLPNGKVDRQALPAPVETTDFAEPEGALEVVLAALWADVLGLEAVGRHDDFFALGGHSLSATRLFARLKETLLVRMPLKTLFEQRTPAALASFLIREPSERERLERTAELILSVMTDAAEEHALGA